MCATVVPCSESKPAGIKRILKETQLETTKLKKGINKNQSNSTGVFEKPTWNQKGEVLKRELYNKKQKEVERKSIGSNDKDIRFKVQTSKNQA